MVKTCIINSLIYYMTKIKALLSEKPISKVLKVFLAIVLIAFSFVLIKSFKTEAQVTKNVTTTVTIGNAAPGFTAGPAESPASSTTTPTTPGNDVTFTATASDSNGQQYYLTVCSVAGITASSSGAGTCSGTDAVTYCSSTATNSGSQASCAYTTQATDPYTNPWYAYVCDADATAPACSSAAQGSGDTGSPFIVNHAPVFTAISNDSPANPGGSITWSATATNSDSTGGDTIKLLVCKTNSISNGACSGDSWCVGTPAASNPTCTYSVPAVMADDDYTAYVFVVDSHNTAATGAAQGTTSNFTISNVAPVVSAVKLNNEGAITLTTKTTTNIPVTLTVNDDNGCATTEVTSVVAYVYRSGVGSTNCDAIEEHNTNYCYAAVNCTQDAGSCTGGASATYTCSVPMQYYADSTDTGSLFPTQYWIATVTATDDDSVSHTASSTTQVDVNSLLAFDVSNNASTVVAEINYGSLGVGEIADATALPQRLYTIPTGNVGLDQKHHSDVGYMCTDFNDTDPDIPCDEGTPIPIAKQHYGLANNVAYSAGTALTTTAVEVELNVPKINAGTITHKSTWWGIQIPFGIIAGTYTGQNIITAVVDETTNRWGLPTGEAYAKP